MAETQDKPIHRNVRLTRKHWNNLQRAARNFGYASRADLIRQLSEHVLPKVPPQSSIFDLLRGLRDNDDSKGGG